MADRDSSGRLLPGHSKMGGRTKREITMAYIDAIVEAHSPEEMRDNLRWCVDHGRKQGWPKIVLAVTEFEADRIMGKPVVRSETTNGNAIEEAMARWKEMQQQSEQAEIEQMYGEPVKE